MKRFFLPSLMLAIFAGLGLVGMYLLENREIEAYNRTFSLTPPQPINVTLTEGSLLTLNGTKGTQYCPWYVQRNAALNTPGIRDLTISDGKTVLLIDGRNVIGKNLLAIDDPNLLNKPRRLQAVLDPLCETPIQVTNAKLHPLWGK